MRIPFTKLHGARNDFLITPAAEVPITDLQELAIAICNRYTGVGGDGWMILDETEGPGYDATIRLFNSDGSEPELSGNGTRCAALLVARKSAKAIIRLQTGAGVKELRVTARKGDRQFQFEMNMGTIRVVDLHAKIHGFDAVVVNAGNPQCAIPVDTFDFDWRKVGADIERDARFPNRTNVSFLRAVDGHSIDVRFWERGAGETNSSGTGSTGAAIAAVARELVTAPVEVLTPAGALQVRIDGDTYLTGPAEYVADGFFVYGKIADTE